MCNLRGRGALIHEHTFKFVSRAEKHFDRFNASQESNLAQVQAGGLKIPLLGSQIPVLGSQLPFLGGQNAEQHGHDPERQG